MAQNTYVPSHFRAQLKAPSAKVRSYNAIFTAQTSEITSATSSVTTRIDLPYLQNSMLDTKQSALRIAVTPKSQNCQLDGSAAALISSISIYSSQNGALLETINSYGLLNQALLSLTTDLTTSNYSLNALMGTHASKARQGISMTADTTYEFMLPLTSILGLFSDYCIPMCGFTLLICWQNPTTAFYGATEGTYNLSRIAYCASVHDLGSELFGALSAANGGTFLIPAVTYKAVTSYTTTATSQSYQLGFRATSIKTIINVLRRQTVLAAIAQRTLSDWQSLGALSKYQFRFGGETIPPQPPTSYPMYFAELEKSFHQFASQNPGLINYADYTNVTAFTTASADTFGSFLIGLDCEPSARDKTSSFLGGWDTTRNTNLYLDLEWSSAPAAGVLDSFALIDLVLKVTMTPSGGVVEPQT